MASELLNVVGEMQESISDSLKSVSSSAQAAKSRLDEVGDQLTEISSKSQVAGSASDSLSQSQAKLAATSQMAASRMDNAGDEAGEMAAKMSAAQAATEALAFDMGSLSFNMGMFTVAVRNLITQVPTLTAVVGTLGAALLGVAGAAAAAAAALGGVIAGGMIAQAQALSEEFESVQGMAEGFEVIMSAIGDLMIDALAPITNAAFADAFVTIVEALASGLNIFAQWVDYLVSGNEQMQQLASSASSALGQGFIDLLDAMTYALEQNGDLLVGLIRLLTSGLADAIIWSTNVLQDLSEMFGGSGVGGSIQQFVQAIVAVTTTLGGGLLPILTLFLNIGSGIADMLSGLSSEAGAALVTTLTMAVAFDRLGGKMVGALDIGAKMISRYSTLTNTFRTTTSVLANMITDMGRFVTEWSSINSAIAGSEMLNIGLTSKLDEAFIGMSKPIANAEDSFRDFFTVTQRTRLATGQFAGNMTGLQREIAGIGDRFVVLANKVGILGDSMDVVSIQTTFFSSTSTTAAMKQGLMNGVLGTAIARYKGLRTAIMSTSAAQWFFNTSIGSAIATLAGLISTTITWAASNLLAIPSIIGLDVAVTSLTGGLNKIIPLLIAFIAAGAAMVGVLGNAGAAGGMLQGVMSALGGLFEWFVATVVPMWISAWNMVVDIVAAVVGSLLAIWNGLVEIGAALGLVSENGKGASGVFAALDAVISPLFTILSATFDILGAIVDIIGSILITSIELLADVIVSIINVLKNLFTWWMDLVTSLPLIGGAISEVVDFVQWLVDAFTSIPDAVMAAFDWTMQIIKDAIAAGIDMINGLIDAANKVPGVSIDKIDDPGFLEDAKVSEEDVAAGGEQAAEGAQDAASSVMGRANPDLSFEENVNNNVEEVNADPEDEERLKRIIKDAMDTANTQRRQSDGYSG